MVNRWFRIQSLLPNGQWQTKSTIDENTDYSKTSREWTLLHLDFTESNYGVKLVHDEIGSALAYMCFSNIKITHSVY